MIARRSAGGTHRSDLLPLLYFLAGRDTERTGVHINRIEPAAVINHNIISHATGIGGSHYSSAISSQNRRSPRCCEVDSVMKPFNMQNRMNPRPIIAGYSGVTGAGPGKHPSIIGLSVFRCQLRSLCRHHFLQGCNLCVLLGDIRFIGLDRRLLVMNVCRDPEDLLILGRDQRLQVVLFLRLRRNRII